MKCSYCGYENKETSRFCENCGAELIQPVQPEEAPAEPEEDLIKPEDDTISGSYNSYDNSNIQEGTGAGIPVQPNGAAQSPYMYQMPPKKKNSKIGIAVLILGFLGMGSAFFGIIAIGLGIFDFVKNKDKKHLLTIIGLVLACLGIVFSGASNKRSKADEFTKTESVAESAVENSTVSADSKVEDSSNTISERDKMWIPTEMTGTRVLGNMSFSEPTEWNPTEADNGMYYYPYGDKQTGLVYVSLNEISYPPEDQLEQKYHEYIVGSVEHNSDNVYESKSIDISGLKGYYAEVIMSLKEEKDYEGLEYIVHDGQYMYSFMFADKGTLSDNMRKAAETLISSVQISKPEVENTQEPVEQPTVDSLTTGQKNALSQAKNYLAMKGFSYTGLVEQLTFEGYSEEDATYAADNCGADWNEQALRSAQSYLSMKAFSASGLKEQLEFESYTSDQADYAVDNCGADWNEQARKAAESYLSMMSFSRDQLIQQLEFEGYTTEQAEYGVSANGY